MHSVARLLPLDIHAAQDTCEGCPFRGPKVGSKGNPEAPLVFVAESPGANEVREGVPLIGPSGKIFHNFVPDDDSIYVLNAMECHPLQSLKKEAIMNKAAMCCHDRLIDRVAAHPRRLVVAMGNPAVRSLTGDYSYKITKIRGRLIESPLAELGIMPIVHIAALMKGTGSFRQWREDILYALELGAGGSPREHIPATVEIVPDDATQEYVDELFAKMDTELTGDTETTGFDHIHDRILSIGVTPSSNMGTSFCFWPIHFPLVKRHLENRAIHWCWHNGKFDIKFLRRAGIQARVDDDTMLMSYTLDEEGGVHDLETVSADVLDAPDYKYMIKPYLPNKDTTYEAIPKQVLAEYQAIDTSNTAQIRDIYRERIRQDSQLEALYTDTLLPASEMLTWVEENGICTDPDRLDENETYFAEMKADIQGQITELTGYELNPGSPKQVSRLLFKGYKFPNRKKGSTDAKVLARLQKDTEHPIFALILKHRKAVKMYGTYVKGLRKHVHPNTNRIHATFLIHGTRTGRLAARDPNLQNAPRLPQVRGTFVAAPGYELIEVDLSQAEIRSLAALSGDETLIECFRAGEDLHGNLAEALFPGWHPEREGAYEQRVKCKNVNFGIMYGITEFGLQGQIGGPLEEARRMLAGWYDQYPGAAEFIRRCRACPASNIIMTTCFGRKKRVGLVSRENLQFLQNEAANFPHQSIATDITTHAAIRTWKELKSMRVRIVNLIHDALLMERPLSSGIAGRKKVIQLVARELRQVPIDYGLTKVPFMADAEYGHRWGSLQKYKGDIYG